MNISISILILQTMILSVIILYFTFEVIKTHSRSAPSKMKSTNSDRVMGLLISLAVCLFIAAFFAPKIFTDNIFKSFFTQNTGYIGDTLGGLMNPFIAMSGVIITGLAFYIQYRANEQSKQQFREQINIQKFESQFYEMLKLHRDNINEMKITGYDFDESDNFKKYEKIIDGRKVFVSMKTELDCIISIYTIKKGNLDEEGFIKCYYLFFFGLEEFEKKYATEENLIILFKKARTQHMNHDKTINDNIKRKGFFMSIKKGLRFHTKIVHLNINYKPFSGHASRLGHYFRHLYMTVNSIVNSDTVTSYHEKMKYLKMLRAQLSNHEQFLLFYNWLGDLGTNWENKKNRFFTEYCMIHNLWYPSLHNAPFIQNKVIELRSKEVLLREGDMFEIDS